MRIARLVAQRLYTLAAAALCLCLAHLLFPRRASTRRPAVLALLASAAAVVLFAALTVRP